MEGYEQEEKSPGEQDLHWEYKKAEQGAKRTEDGLYICPSCGAEVEADVNTVSTVCPYCDNVVVIHGTSSGEFEPDAMIPFQVKGEEARQKMQNFCKGKHLLPKNFRDRSYLKNLRGCYVPYWLFDCKASADMSFNATRIRAWSDSEYDYTETSYYLVTRAGTMEFVHVPVDGSAEMDDDTTESIEPFDYRGLTEFQSAYLAGYETDKYDVDAKAAEGRAKERLYNSAEDVLRSTVQGYHSVTVRRRPPRAARSCMRSCLSGCSRPCTGGKSISLPSTDRMERWWESFRLTGEPSGDILADSRRLARWCVPYWEFCCLEVYNHE